MKTLLEYFNQPILTEGQSDVQNVADGKFGEKDMVNLFKKAGIKADVAWLSVPWRQVNMNEKRAPKLWDSVLKGEVYADRPITVKVSPKDLDKLFKFINDKFSTDVEKLTREYKGHAYLSLNWSHPDWNNYHGTPDKMCLYDENGVYIFLNWLKYDDEHGAINPNDCREAGNGDILTGARKLAKEIYMTFDIWVEVPELAADNFVYPVNNAGGSNDCLGKPIQLDNIVVYQTSTGLEVGKVIGINGKSIEILMNNQFGKTVTFNNGKKMCVIDNNAK